MTSKATPEGQLGASNEVASQCLDEAMGRMSSYAARIRNASQRIDRVSDIIAGMIPSGMADAPEPEHTLMSWLQQIGYEIDELERVTERLTS